MKRNRIWELDFLRGVSIILLVFDHLMFYISMIPQLFSNYFVVSNPFIIDLVHRSYDYWDSMIRNVGHAIFVTIFLLLVGISSTFSHNNLKRGTKIFALGMGLTLVTSILTFLGIDEVLILFGILHLIGLGVILYHFINKLPSSKFIFLITGTIIFIIGLANNMYYPPYIGHINNFKQLMDMFIGNIITGGDSFGIYYLSIIFIGAFIGKTLYENKKSLLPILDGKWNKPICWCGRNTLLFYLATPVISFILIFIVCLSLGYRF